MTTAPAARNPWVKWYPAVWRADPRLRMCSLATRGLWIECLGLMHEANPRGFLVVGDREPTPAQLAGLVGATVAEVRRAMQELEQHGVFSRDDAGRIYSRRMLRDMANAERDRINGKRGGNPVLTSTDNPVASNDDKAGDNPTDKAKKLEGRSKSNPPTSLNVVESSGRPPSTGSNVSHGTRLPRDFAMPSPWFTFARHERPEWTDAQIDRVAASFVDFWHAKPGQAGRKADWLATWRNWVRNEGRNGAGTGRSSTAHDDRMAVARAIMEPFTHGHDTQNTDTDPRDVTGEGERIE